MTNPQLRHLLEALIDDDPVAVRDAVLELRGKDIDVKAVTTGYENDSLDFYRMTDQVLAWLETRTSTYAGAGVPLP